MKQRNGWTSWLSVPLGTAVIAAMAMGAVACSEPAAESGCEIDDDCPEGQLCDRETDSCVDISEFSCSEHDDCPDDRLCQDDVCVQADEFVCESRHDCPDGNNCDHGQCVLDVIEHEDYGASFVAERDVFDDGEWFTEREFFITDSNGEPNESFDTGDLDCADAIDCGVTADGNHLIVIEEDGDTAVASAAPVEGEPPAVVGDAEVLAEGITNPRIVANGVAFEEIHDGQYYAFYRPVEGEEREVAALHADQGQQRPHGWQVFPEQNLASQFQRPDHQNMDVRLGTIDAPLIPSDHVYRMDGHAAVGTGAGGFFPRRAPGAVSDDGRLFAYSVVSPNLYGECGDHSDCTETGQRCGEVNRCYAFEPTVHIVDREHSDTLDTECTGHDDCGPIHRCDSGTDDFEDGLCAPARITVGLGDTQVDACAKTREEGSFEFTDINGPLSFGPDGRVYFVGVRNCTPSQTDPDDDVEADIPRTSIVAADPWTGQFEEVFGNIEGENYDGSHCGDIGEDYDASNECSLYIEDARLSPNGNDLVFRASFTGGHSNAEEILHLWRARRDGETFSLIGEPGIKTIESLTLFSYEDDDEEQQNDEEQDDDNGDE